MVLNELFRELFSLSHAGACKSLRQLKKRHLGILKVLVVWTGYSEPSQNNVEVLQRLCFSPFGAYFR